MEDKFYLTISIVAVVALVVALSYVGILLYTTKPTAVFPETVSKCPDYWEVDTTGDKCKIKKDEKNTGTLVFDITTKQLNENNISSLVTNGAQSGSVYPKSVLDVTDTSWEASGIDIGGLKTGSALCKKARWARSKGIIWQGVSNTNAC